MFRHFNAGTLSKHAMRKCEDCKVILDSSARFCPKCGKSVGGEPFSQAAAPPNVGRLIASANLHRLRAEWDEAIDAAAEALKLDPTRAEVASLLGAIYEQRSMFEEAQIWYQMAVELDPDSGADKAALERVKQRLTSGGRDRFVTVQKQTKVWGMALAAMFLMVVLAAVILALARPQPTREPAASAVEGTTPARSEATPRPPTSVPSETAGAPESAAAQAVPVAPLLRTPAEAAIRAELDKSADVRRTGAVVDDVVADPRDGVAVVTFSTPAKLIVTRPEVIRSAGAAARAAFAANTEVRFVTAKCLIKPAGAQSVQIGFVGDISRITMDAQGQNPTDEQLLAAFARQWWNPQITPSQPTSP